MNIKDVAIQRVITLKEREKVNTILAHKLINKTAVAVELYPHLKNTSAWGKLAQKLDKGNGYELTEQEERNITAQLHGLADLINQLFPRATGLGRTGLRDLKDVNPSLAKLLGV